MTSKNTRPYRAGLLMAEALCEVANILYLLDNRLEYLSGIEGRIKQERIILLKERGDARQAIRTRV